MATLGNGLNLSQYSAAQNIDQYTFCEVKNGSVYPPQAGGYTDGVSLEQYIKDQAVLIRYLGTAKVICGADVADGQFLSTDQFGHAVPCTGETTVVAKAMEAGAKGQVIEIILLKMPPAQQKPSSEY
jgi:hypothetical protein